MCGYYILRAPWRGGGGREEPPPEDVIEQVDHFGLLGHWNPMDPKDLWGMGTAQESEHVWDVYVMNEGNMLVYGSVGMGM